MVGMGIILVYAIVASVATIVSQAFILWKIVSLGVFLLALWLAVQRDTYLPFLGYAAIPSSVIFEPTAPSNANVYLTLPINAPNGTKVMYWGAKPTKMTLPNPWEAYDHFANAGVVEVQDEKATIRFHCPAKYRIPGGYELKRHIHYRVQTDDGMFGPVETKYVDCENL